MQESIASAQPSKEAIFGLQHRRQYYSWLFTLIYPQANLKHDLPKQSRLNGPKPHTRKPLRGQGCPYTCLPIYYTLI